MQLVSKVSFLYSADLRTRCARAANFPSRKKSITLLTYCINNYYWSYTFLKIPNLFSFLKLTLVISTFLFFCMHLQ
jgi:hypothetical protein